MRIYLRDRTLSAAQVHAVMAAALEDADRLQQWMRDPEQVREFGVDPDQVDWQGLWRFAGLTTKVRHNPLRADLPLTFRALKATALELEVFSHYAPEAARLRARGKNGVADKIQSLCEFLEGWLDPADDRHTLIRDVLRHEVIIARLRELPHDAVQPPRPASSPRGPRALVPRVRGTLVLERMSYDPAYVQEQVLGRIVDIKALEKQNCLLGYWLDDAGGPLRLLRLDALGFHLLELTDGLAAIGAIGQGMRGSGIDIADEELADAFTSLCEQGLVILGEDSSVQ